MVVVCSICKKTYANKYSLAAHKRRYHKDDVLDENEEHDALDQEKDNDVFSMVDQNSNNGTEVSEWSEQMEDNDEEMAANEEENKHLSNEESEEEEEGEEKSSSEKEEGENASNSDREVSEEHSSDDESDGMTDSTQHNARFSDKNLPAHDNVLIPTRLVNIMKSIEKHLEDAQEVNNLQLLDSYELKNRFFNELTDFFTNRNVSMEDVLTNKELMLTSAVLTTKDIFAVCKLLSENIDIICSIKNKIKQYEDESESDNSSGVNEKDATPKKGFHCLICDIPFSNSHLLTNHFGANHTGPNGVHFPNVESLKFDKLCLEKSSNSENSSCEESNKSDHSNNGDSEPETKQSNHKKHRYCRGKEYFRTDVTKIAKNPKLVRSIFRMILNGDIPLDEKHIQKLQPHKHAIRKIASSTSNKNRRLLKNEIGKHIQTGGSMLGSVLKVVAPIFQTLIS